MAVMFAAAVVLAVYLANIPLKIALIFRTDPQLELSSGAAIFDGRFALKRALGRKKRKGQKNFPGPGLLKSALPAARHLLSHTRLEHFSARGSFALPDAAATALLAGLVRSLQAACMPFGDRVLIDLQPDFSGAGVSAELRGIISLRAGHIILAALIFAQERVKERFKLWTTGIRSKALCRPRWKISVT